MSTKEHWEKVYLDRDEKQVSWYQHRLNHSLDWITIVAWSDEFHIVDIGGGASTLVDHLLDLEYDKVTVLDISSQALATAKRRLGEAAEQVNWIEADITGVEFDKPVDLWHDRAVFHFLTEPDQRAAYVNVLRASMNPNRHVIIATFAPEGPEKCSGLPVVRYSPETLAAELGEDFHLEDVRQEVHVTPAGNEQHFVFCLFKYQPQQTGRN